MDDKNTATEQTLTNVHGISATAYATLDRSRTCDQSATVRDFFRSYAQFVWRTARYLGVSESDLDDVSQEVFTVVHRRIGDFEARSSPRTWIYGICIRVVSAYRRRAFRRHERLFEKTPDQVSRETPESSYKQRQARELLQSALDQIDADKRAVFVLYELEQLKMDEIADIVGCRRKTAYSRLYAARKDVLRILKQTTNTQWGSDG
ncbi:MAG: sigma-70 family RNA polymerase sigma factor [Deltaproteobacteria bacterium]|nr:sigma-70 family RNA polymerase sigma factor [Deltaproteobacteria bacterium]